MSRLSRKYSETGVYHILFRGVNQQNIFEEKQDYIKLQEIILDVKEEMDFKRTQTRISRKTNSKND